MDPVTQIALGASIGELTLGRRVGRRALLWGGVCGAIPDLDVLVPFSNAVETFTYHRSATHSYLMMAAVTPLIAWLIVKIHTDTRQHWRRWLLLVYATFATHILLDSLTVYGTQVFWPLASTPVGWSTIFIIDPLYTLPLLVGILGALMWTTDGNRGHRWNNVALTLGTAYLLWGIGAKHYIESMARHSLAQAGIHYEQLLSTPAPFNSLLWRVITVSETESTESFYSVLDDAHEVPIARRPRQLDLLAGIESEWPVKRLAWFSKGFFSVRNDNGDVVVSDLRMGAHPFYAFQFKVGERSSEQTHAAPVEQIASEWRAEQLESMLRRIWTPTAWPPPG